MSDGLLATGNNLLEDGMLSSSSTSERGLTRNNLLSNKIATVLSKSYIDPEIKNALSILECQGFNSTPSSRAGLSFEAQEQLIECNGAIVQDFGRIAEVFAST